MGILSDNQQKEPLHYGEVFSLWSYLSAAKGYDASYQTMYNHAGDKDLKRILEELVQGIKQESEEIEEVLKINGVVLPPSPPERSIANSEDIPAGAKLNDPEISAAITMNIAQGLVACSQAIGQSTREDIAMLFGKFHMNKTQAGSKILRLNKEKGWLVVPPLHK
ncbi:DUF3231 family protein [Halobacillus karajensis]|uniref:DUF3231 family protein n=1 Tax=Halobacillus karajensis TaxID=195088 RepID=A0A024P4F2_9BACI|nr:DUF3231 family protein [Halobacillus karajensis]CDQ20587.1 hypothetical protein BN982_02937 [Halobacillus karajensis]CDQ23944.1 hypothetical protein BN983_02200 [Halobacillus karajensis]CDQ27422.1 hypothetical protein BN981_01681 [Halobacillus karajensis]